MTADTFAWPAKLVIVVIRPSPPVAAKRYIAVVYDVGSLSPMRIVAAASELACGVIFIAPSSRHNEEMIDVLDMLGVLVKLDIDAPEKCLTWLRRFAVAGILTFAENLIPVTSELAIRLGLPYHDPVWIPAITQKDLQRVRLRNAGVEDVRTFLLNGPDDIDKAVDYLGPSLVLKPVKGSGSLNTVAVHSAAECREVFASLLGQGGSSARDGGVLAEEMLQGRPVSPPWGDYIAVDCVADDEGVRPIFVTSKFALAEPFRERGGYGVRSILDGEEIAAIERLACGAVDSLGIYGMADVEIKLTPHGPRVIEVNGRLGAWVDDLAVRSGASNPADAALRACIGLRQSPAPLTREDSPIAFHYSIVPPKSACLVGRVAEPADIRRMAGVERMIVLAEPGDPVDWRLGAGSTVGAAQGATRSHAALATVVSAIEASAWITYAD